MGTPGRLSAARAGFVRSAALRNRSMTAGRRDFVVAGACALFAAQAKADDKPVPEVRAIVAGPARSKAALIEDCVTQVECTTANGQKTNATGFVYRFATPAGGLDSLITNRHVLTDAASVTLYFRVRSDRPASPTLKGFRIDDVQKKTVYHPQAWVDLAALPLFDVAAALRESRIEVDASYLTRANILSERALQAIGPIADVLIVGHPQGMMDVVQSAPIARRGITATPAYEHYGGAPDFLIDARLSHGSSGSPVFLDNLGGARQQSWHAPLGNTVVLLGVVSEMLGGWRSQENEAAVASAVPNGWILCWMAPLLFDLEAAIVSVHGK